MKTTDILTKWLAAYGYAAWRLGDKIADGTVKAVLAAVRVGEKVKLPKGMRPF